MARTKSPAYIYIHTHTSHTNSNTFQWRSPQNARGPCRSVYAQYKHVTGSHKTILKPIHRLAPHHSSDIHVFSMSMLCRRRCYFRSHNHEAGHNSTNERVMTGNIRNTHTGNNNNMCLQRGRLWTVDSSVLHIGANINENYIIGTICDSRDTIWRNDEMRIEDTHYTQCTSHRVPYATFNYAFFEIHGDANSGRKTWLALPEYNNNNNTIRHSGHFLPHSVSF